MTVLVYLCLTRLDKEGNQMDSKCRRQVIAITVKVVGMILLFSQRLVVIRSLISAC